ncbi:hypothetical protein EON63_09990 [archaeon]|nr:MAG: hypothetical protein EON63_09990 [archaeon]
MRTNTYTYMQSYTYRTLNTHLNPSHITRHIYRVHKAQSRTDRTIAKYAEKPQAVAFNSASVHVTFISHQVWLWYGMVSWVASMVYYTYTVHSALCR